MAFIPIDAKADVKGSKKGKLTPAQHAQLNAWCLAQKTGILDCLDRCVAENLTYTASNNFATIVLKKGYVVICGRLVECEAGTEVQVQTPTVGTTTGSIVLRYDLSSSKEEEFTVKTKVGSLVQQDLNDNPLTGIYEFELYSYTATSTTVTLSRTGNYVPDIGGEFKRFEKSLKDEGKPLHGYRDSEGTIEDRLTNAETRLTNLGFKEATISNLNSTYIKQIVAYEQGKVVALKITLTGAYKSGLSGVVAKINGIDLSFLESQVFIGATTSSSGVGGGGTMYYSGNYFYLNNNGEITVSSANVSYKNQSEITKQIAYIEGKEDKYTLLFV